MKILTALIFAVLMIPVGPEPAFAATLRQAATVDAEVVRLGDIFLGAGKLAETVVAAAPAPGRSELFNAPRLRSIAEEAGLAWAPRSRYEKIVIERTGQPVATAEIEAALRRALDEAGAPRARRIQLAKRDLAVHAAIGAAEPFRVADVRYDGRTGRFAAVVEVAVGAKSMDRMQVSGMLYDVMSVPVLNRSVQRGEIVREDDIDMIELDRAAVPRNAITEKDQIVGQTPRRVLRPGAPLNAGDLQAPVVIAKNSLVTVTLRTERMQLTAQGKALDDGAAGETIRVLNTRSKTTIEARVVGPGQAAITLPTATN